MLSVALVIAGSKFTFAVIPNVPSQWLIDASSVFLPLTLIWAAVRWLIRWRDERWWTVLPIAACLVAGPLGSALGGETSYWDFKWRRSPAYDLVLDSVLASRAELGPAPSLLKDLTEPSAWPVLAQKSQDGRIVVVFVRGYVRLGGWPSQFGEVGDVAYIPADSSTPDLWQTDVVLNLEWSHALR